LYVDVPFLILYDIDSINYSRARTRWKPVAIYPHTRTNDGKRIPDAVLHCGRLREAGRLGRDASVEGCQRKAESLCYRLRDGQLSSSISEASLMRILCQCLTEDGKELTRVCLIDFYSGKVMYDQLVKPAKPILDYLTR